MMAEVISESKPARDGPKWQADALNRLRNAIRKYAKPLSELIARDANEGDTRLLVTDFLCEGLGYDKYEHLTTEYAVRGEFADYGIRIDKQLVAFIEVKRTTTKLSDRHLRQVEMYAVNEGVEWMILTSGATWQAYHLSPGMPVEIDLALDVNLLGDGTVAAKAQALFYLTLESMRKRQIDELWKAKRATSPKSLASILCSEPVLETVRRELRRATGHRVDNGELLKLLRGTVIRQECL
jgi:predicted type IV restriction endonuclease